MDVLTFQTNLFSDQFWAKIMVEGSDFIFFHFEPKYINVPKMKFLVLEMNKFLFAGYTLPLLKQYVQHVAKL